MNILTSSYNFPNISIIMSVLMKLLTVYWYWIIHLRIRNTKYSWSYANKVIRSNKNLVHKNVGGNQTLILIVMIFVLKILTFNVIITRSMTSKYEPQVAKCISRRVLLPCSTVELWQDAIIRFWLSDYRPRHYRVSISKSLNIYFWQNRRLLDWYWLLINEWRWAIEY